MKKKKILSWLLVLAMCLTLIPAAAVPASAVEEHDHTGYTEWTDTLANSQLGGDKNAGNSLPISKSNDKTAAYYLTKDVTLTSPWEVQYSNNITIDLNGHSIKYQQTYSESKNAVITVGSGSSLTITDCKTVDTAGVYHQSDSTYIKYIFENNGTLTLAGNAKASVLRNSRQAVGVYNGRADSHFIMEDNAELTVKTTASYQNAYGVESYGSVTLQGKAVLSAEANAAAYGVYLNSGSNASGTVAVQGSAEVHATSTAASTEGIHSYGGKSITVSDSAGVSAESGSSSSLNNVYGIYTTCTTNISGSAKVTATRTQNAKAAGVYSCGNTTVSGNANVTGTTCGVNVYSTSGGTTIVTGGTLSGTSG